MAKAVAGGFSVRGRQKPRPVARRHLTIVVSAAVKGFPSITFDV